MTELRKHYFHNILVFDLELESKWNEKKPYTNSRTLTIKNPIFLPEKFVYYFIIRKAVE